LSPALPVQHGSHSKAPGAAQCRARAHVAIERFFGVTDVLDQFGRSLFTEPSPENRVVALSEGGQELSVGDGEAFADILSRQACQ